MRRLISKNFLSLVLFNVVAVILISCSNGDYKPSSLPATRIIILTTQLLPSSSQVVQGQTFDVIVTLSESNLGSQTISVNSLTTYGITVVSNPSTCIINAAIAGQESCVFSITPLWNQAAPGSYKLNFSNVGGTIFNGGVSNLMFTVLQPTVYLPQTGENPSTNGCPDPFVAADCNLQSGLVWPNPRFIAMTGTGSNSCLTDSLTDLMWVAQLNDVNGGNFAASWNDAFTIVNNFNIAGYCGHNDWRLPNINELSSLVNYGYTISPANYLNISGFFNMYGGGYWTSSVSALNNADGCGNNPFCAWVVDFGYGVISNSTTDVTYNNVLPVRGETHVTNTNPELMSQVAKTGQTSTTNYCPNIPSADCNLQAGLAWPNPRFVTVPESGFSGSCLSDNLTGLMWVAQLNDINSGQPSADWNLAFTAVESLNAINYCGYNDWHLPNVIQLRSLVNYGYGGGQSSYLNSVGFANVQPENAYWTSSNEAATTGAVFIIYFTDGTITYIASSSSNYYVSAVRGGR